MYTSEGQSRTFSNTSTPPDCRRLHRGLSETRVDNFIKWYLYFNDEKKKNK